MDASAVTGLVKQLQEANTPVKPDTDNAEQAQQSKNEVGSFVISLPTRED